MQENFKTYLSSEDIDTMIDSCKYFRDKVIIRLLGWTGIRVSELVKLKTDDIGSNEIRIEWLKKRKTPIMCDCGIKNSGGNKYCRKCGVKLEGPKIEEKKKLRIIEVDTDTLSMLNRYIKERKNKGDEIFNLNRFDIREIVKNAAIKVDLPKLLNPDTGKYHYVSPHKLRDAFAVEAIREDNTTEGQRMLQLHLGHESFDTTARYLKYGKEARKEWYKKVIRKR